MAIKQLKNKKTKVKYRDVTTSHYFKKRSIWWTAQRQNKEI